jgi:D-alanyl-D-alanine carboxypeptidase
LAKVQQKAAEKAAAKAAKAKAKADAKEAEVAKLKAAVEAKAAAKAAAAPKQKVAMLVPPAPPSTASTPDSLNWGIQIGAYSDAAIGAQALSDLTSSMPDQLTGADPQVQKISSGGVPMYRARLMSLDKKTAQSICSYLIQHGKSCLTVEP